MKLDLQTLKFEFHMIFTCYEESSFNFLTT